MRLVVIGQSDASREGNDEMKAVLCLVMLALGLIILSATGDAQSPPLGAGGQFVEAQVVEEQAVRAKLKQIQDAAQGLDAEKVFSYVLDTDKGSLVQDGKVLLTRQAALESTQQGMQGLGKIGYEFNQQHITLLSPTIALAVGEGVSSATTVDGRIFSTPFAQSVVLVKSAEGWMVAHAHRSFPDAP